MKFLKILPKLCALIVLSLLFACQWLDEDKPEQPQPPPPPEKKKTSLFEEDEKRKKKDADENPKEIKSDAVKTLGHDPETTTKQSFENLANSEKKNKAEDLVPFYEKYIKTEDVDKAEDVVLSFDATEISEAVPAFAQFLGFNYLLDPKVKGTVTMTLNTKMTKRQVWEVFEQILWLSGAYCSPDGEILHILPFKNMPQERRMLVKHSALANVEVSIINVQNTSVKDLIEKIKPFLTEGASAIDIPYQNAIMLVEAPSNMPKLRTLIEMLDQKNKANWPQVIIRCDNISATRIKNELAEIMPVLGFPVSLDGEDPSAINLISLDRLQVLIASAANDGALKELKEWAKVLDRSDVGEQERVFIYKVVNSKSEDLCQAVSAIFNVDASSSSSASTSASSSLSSSSKTKKSSDTKTSSTDKSNSASVSKLRSSSSSSSNSNNENGPANVFETPVKIFTDTTQNRLIIRTTPRTYAMIKAILINLDTIPSQVLLQIMVAEVSLTNDTEFGLEFSNENQGTVGSSALNNLYKTNFESLSPGSTTDYGFTYLLTDKNNPDSQFAYLKALAGKGKINVISSPQLLATSNTEAKISVGDQVPIVTAEITDTASTTTDNTSLRRSIEYKDTGIILEIKPQVTKGGLITFELEQTVSDAVENNTSGIDSPKIQERILKTVMSLRDGRTLILGGLIKEKLEDTQSTVPFISDIPIIGRMFGNNTIKKSRTELLILITGRIITEDTKLEELIRRYKQSIKSIEEMRELEREEYEEKNPKLAEPKDTAERLLNIK